MKCKNCCKELFDDAKFCDSCGTAVTNGETAQNFVSYENNVSAPITPKRKSVFRRWWFWLIVGFVIFSAVMGILFGEETDTSTSNDVTGVTATEKIDETEVETTVAPTTENNEESFKESCFEIDFDTLARNPEKYKGNNYVFTGEVIQVSEGFGDKVTLRVNITKTEYEYIDTVMWTDTILATVNIPKGEDKILEDDIIKFWGICDGEYTYESVLGSSITLPKISIEYYELISE